MCPFNDKDVDPFDEDPVGESADSDDDAAAESLPDEDYDDLDDDTDDYDDDEDDDTEDDEDDDTEDDEDADDEDDYDDLDDLEDALEDEIDLVVALYDDDGERIAVSLDKQLANDLDELITQLRRLPGDAGAVGMVSIDHQFFVIVRVRGRHVGVFLSDAVEGNDWPIARDVADYLGDDIPDPDDDPEPMGDYSLLSDAGISEFDLEAFADLDEDSDEVLAQIAKRINYGRQFSHASPSIR
ncbi:tRNA adenosine deaminase-associated protein [Acidipropionibacterium thoenii]|uniref:tRNA adenosine deaminase-associated protein n=1 Tax=Acidipropionibacterium thoenii TaxID=1751 RepID=UPI000423F73B|nr:tRNA adenosine deaminase-associated protein [Acidipropionibacterium thoenii]